ncbi:MAG: TonB-dependent receptor [Gracilimonas sp.]|nr:TonB-dependent receptor [Gracilimonas sp.]
MTVFLLLCANLHAQITISGHIYDNSEQEALPGATLYLPELEKGTATNAYGFYSLTINSSPVKLSVSYLGYETIDTLINLEKNKTIDFYLVEQVGQLGELHVSATNFELQEQVNSTKMSTVNIKPREITNIPTLAGEADLIKVAQLMPGITSGNEGTTGMFVRGGTDDQNLVILDDAVVYNLSHLFGFFSVFNSDAIKDVEITKGGFTPDHGGRLSSVMDIRMNDGSFNRYNARGGIGLLTSRLTVDGPILKDKMSFMLAARRTYIDRLFGLFGADLPYYFYDFNAKLNYKVSNRDRIYLSSYYGDDVLSFDEASNDSEVSEGLDFGFRLGNFTSTLRWNHIYDNQKLFSNVTLHQTRFNYDISGDFIDNSLLIRSQIQDVGLKADWQYFLTPDNSFIFGAQAVTHFFRPNVISTSGDLSELIENSQGGLIQNTEWSVYGGNERKLTKRLKVNYGLRYSLTSSQGKIYSGPEPRLSIRYKIDEHQSFKTSYSLMRQYMHRVSSSSIALPTDLWYPVTRNVKPQKAHQIALGYNRIFPASQFSFSAETYYKVLDQLIEYREGANLVLNDNFEQELITGKGNSYGIEFLIRKKRGSFTGWVSYALSKTSRNFDQLNDGNTYPAKFDRRHVATLVSMFNLNERVSFSAVWTFQSGARFTPQTGQFLMPNASLTQVELIPIYGDRNSTQLGNTHRLDINFILKPRGNDRIGGEWHIGAYNFYNRAAPFRVDIQNNGVTYEYVQQGLFGFIPSISYNFNFSSK